MNKDWLGYFISLLLGFGAVFAFCAPTEKSQFDGNCTTNRMCQLYTKLYEEKEAYNALVQKCQDKRIVLNCKDWAGLVMDNEIPLEK